MTKQNKLYKKQNNMKRKEDQILKNGYIKNSIHKLNKMMTKKQRYQLIRYIENNKPNAKDWKYKNINLINIYFTFKQQKNNVLKHLYNIKKYN